MISPRVLTLTIMEPQQVCAFGMYRRGSPLVFSFVLAGRA
jgi:hypothetical protein